MASVKTNVLANYAGQLAATITSFLVVPFYIRYLGKEAYGLVGFFLSLQAVVAILDMGLAVTANREVSRLMAGPAGPGGVRNLIRTLEWFYGGVGMVVFLALAAAAPWIASDWVRVEELPCSVVETCVILAAATIGLRWPVSLYQGVLRGMERQVELNLVQSALAVLKGMGAVLVLHFTRGSVVQFHVWQLVIGLGEVLWMLLIAWKGAGGLTGGSAAWSSDIFRAVWRFAFKVGGTSVLAMLLKQVDRMLISRLLPIEQLGYYTTAVIAGMGLAKIFMPVQSAVFPRLTRLHALGDSAGLARTFHGGCQTVAFLMAVPAAMMIFFPGDILFVWTRSEVFADKAAAPLAVTALAMLFNSMMSIPFSLAIGAGLTWLPLWTNGLGVALLLPLTFWSVSRYGIVGGAWAWLVFNLLYFLIVPHILFRHVLPREKWRWYLRDTVPFIALVLTLFAGARWAAGAAPGHWAAFGWAALAGACYLGICLAAFSELRSAAARLPGLRLFFAPSGAATR